ncbi:MAG: hypothetical protein K9J37_23330 [Saprospiraceae bacterium]|nr:hypothetical protein [Saprospiraceae bacterium]MCF8252859.1 hypothetical protein [Saprospiraceae bacterium]MCF8314411.1 hypothetical protein [Saprospiraceae bacterium]MCF8443301.1 hypothetical protein [Saprospiraceae bacterium]
MIQWLMEGDVSIQYQVQRDLFRNELPELQKRIKNEGWGKAFLSKRNRDGHWGLKFYEPKWISTHYTLLDLKNLAIAQDVPEIQETIQLVLRKEKAPDGGIKPIGATKQSDVCINGMFLNYASYFKSNADDLRSVVDFLLSQYMPDGGFNCESNRRACVHSSLHSTLSVLEGILEYQENGYIYRLAELQLMAETSREFILMHRLFKSDKTGAIIDKRMTMLSFPSRWRYDILRALDYFQKAAIAYDPRMDDALEILRKKRKAEGKWPLQCRHPGQVHFEMEAIGKPSRWNTLRALRVFGRLVENK